MSLVDGLLSAAARFPDKDALEDDRGQSHTFAQLLRDADLLANHLRATGIERNDRVALICPNQIDAITFFWGILFRGSVVVWIDEKRPLKELHETLEHCDASLIICHDANLVMQIESDIKPQYGIVTPDDLRSNIKASASTPLTAIPSNDDLAVIVYTSGSSGKPKGVCLSHGNLSCVADAITLHMPISPDDTYLMLVPLHYIHGLIQLLVHNITGAKIFLGKGFQFPRLVTNQIVATKVSGFSGVPFHFSALMERGGLLEQTLPDLRWVTSTGGTLAANQIARFTKAFPHVDFHIAYGQTECAPRATALHPSKTARKPDSVGAPIPGVVVQIFDPDGNELPCGESGEIVISGPNIMQGYWKDPDGTAEAVDAHGRLHTGDLGHIDDDGDLYLDGRVTELVKSAGERISPSQIENILSDLEWVQEAIVQSSPDELYGQAIRAHIRLDQHVKPIDFERMVGVLNAHCLEHSTLARSPRHYFFWSRFPLLPNGKIDKTALAKIGSESSTDLPGLVFSGRPGRGSVTH